MVVLEEDEWGHELAFGAMKGHLVSPTCPRNLLLNVGGMFHRVCGRTFRHVSQLVVFFLLLVEMNVVGGNGLISGLK